MNIFGALVYDMILIVEYYYTTDFTLMSCPIMQEIVQCSETLHGVNEVLFKTFSFKGRLQETRTIKKRTRHYINVVLHF